MCGSSEKINLISMMAESQRARSSAEIALCCAVIGAFGAVSWGVAALATISEPKLLSFGMPPEMAAILGCFLIAISVCWKIADDHKKYKSTREDQIKVSRNLEKEWSELLPKELRPNAVQILDGYRYTIWIISVAWLATLVFCLSVYDFRVSKTASETRVNQTTH